MNFGVLLVVFVAMAMAERLYERRYSRSALRGARRMEWSFTLFHTLHSVIYLGTVAEYFLLRRNPSWPVTAAGGALFVLSLLVRLTAIRTLGRYWSLHLEIRPEHQLITEGIYRHVRHPAYSAIFVEVISLPLVGCAYYTLAAAVITYVPLLLARWQREEQEMIAKFGDRYERYRKQVPAFWPRFRNRWEEKPIS